MGYEKALEISHPTHMAGIRAREMHRQEGELRRPSTGYPITHDRRTSAPFLRQGIPSAATTWHYGGPDVLSHEEEAELEALRLQAARLRQEALREDASRDELERQVELLGREYRLALDEQHRLEGQLQMATSRLAKSAESAETAGQEEQAMDSARRLLANLLTSDLKKVSRPIGSRLLAPVR